MLGVLERGFETGRLIVLDSGSLERWQLRRSAQPLETTGATLTQIC
jgi:hypothetical protein